MKKLVFIFFLVATGVLFARTIGEIKTTAAGITNVAERSKYVDTLTEAEYRLLLDDVLSIAATNVMAAQDAFAKPINLRWRLFCSCRQLSGEYDEKLSRAGICTDPCVSYEHMPLCSENFIANSNNTAWIESRAYFVSLIRKHNTHRLYTYSLPELVNLAAALSAIGRQRYYMRDNYKSSILSHSAKPIKRRIREMGGSFVIGADGKNPVQEAIDELSNVLNAPKMSGAKQWVAKWFPDHAWVEPKWMADGEVAKLREDVLYGEKDFGYAQVCILEAYLGTEAYNAFVKEYNGNK